MNHQENTEILNKCFEQVLPAKIEIEGLPNFLFVPEC